MEYPAYIGLFQSQVDNTPPLFITTQLVHPRKGPMHILCHTPSDSHVLMVQTPSFDFDPSRQTGPAILSAPTMSHGNEQTFYPCQPLTNDEIPWGVGAGGYKQDNVGELIHSHMALNGLKRITKLENGSDTLVQECFEKRSQRLADIDPETIRQAIYGLLTASPNAPCIPAMANLARALRIYPCSLPTLVDDQGNPYSEHILAFVDTVLILYRSVATSPIPPESAENEDGTDEQAFGALTATSLASRILILIPHAHHHILRALWYALLYLSIAYSGSQRGVAVDYLIDRIYAQWHTGQDDAKARWRPAWSSNGREQVVEEEWMRRAQRIGDLRRKGKTKLRVGDIWAEMKGMAAMGPLPPAEYTVVPEEEEEN